MATKAAFDFVDEAEAATAANDIASGETFSELDESVRLLGQLEDLLRQAKDMAAAAMALGKARELVDGWQADYRARRAILLLREKAGETDGLLDDIESLVRDDPADRVALEMYMRALLNIQAKDRALAALDSVFSAESASPQVQAERAELLDRVKLFAESDAAYARALALRDQPSVRIDWAKRLAKRFRFEDAGQLLDGLAKRRIGEKAQALVVKIEAERAFFRRFRSTEELVGKDFRIIAMELAVLHFRNRQVRPTPLNSLKLNLVTGNLGAGGAERQLCALARLVKASIGEGTPPSGSVGFSDVEVIVKEHSRAGISDFFLEDLREAGVPVHQVNDMKPVKANQQVDLDSDPDLAHLLNMLPAQVHYGVVRLSPCFRASQPDLVSLWQDGACLFGALAALFAGVPRIQLVFRGLPPNIRLNRFKPEYELLYRALAKIPGVEFVCNSLASARAYTEWLSLPVDRITVLYNGVAVSDDAPTDTDRQNWENFASATSGATETIGGVFRFESDKRPLVWIRIAVAYLRKRPGARFVIVGDGRLLANAREKAERLGIAERMLFVGNSRAVGFWYDRLDVKVLTSRFEGLPNVLIEAQSRGCPVVSTPAGGAAECFVPGLTGHLLDCAENPDPELACERIRYLVDLRRSEPERMRLETQNFARRFDVEVFFEGFQTICGLPVRSVMDT